MRPIKAVAVTAKTTVMASEIQASRPLAYPFIALNGIKKVEMKGIKEPIFRTKLSPAAPREVTPTNPAIIKIINGDKAFPASSGRETIDPRKAAKTTYIKRLTKTNNKVLSEKASPI